MGNTIKPIHDQLISVTSATAFDNFTNFEDLSTTTYQTLVTTNSTAFDTWATSSFQVLNSTAVVLETTLVDYFNLRDSLTTTYNETTLIDYLNLRDEFYSGASKENANFSGTVRVDIRDPVPVSLTTKIDIKQRVTLGLTTNVNTLAKTLVPVTSPTAVGNPFAATYIQNGVVVYSSTATLPSQDISKAKCYVAMKCADLIGPADASEILNWNISINDAYPNWRVNTVSSVGNFFDEVSVMGLTGTIINKGFEWSNSSAGVTAGGILAAKKLNKKLGYLLYGNNTYAPLLVGPGQSKPPLSQYKTHADAAKQIASLAGATLDWTIPDQPLINFAPQMTQKAIEALASLAAEVGGVLRWTGGTNYRVTYPDVSLGMWQIPDCCLITAFAKDCTADIDTGRYSPGTDVLPKWPEFDAGTINKQSNEDLPSAASGGAVIAKDLYLTKQLVTDADPLQTIDLPWDFDTIYIQNVCKTDGQGPFVTLDPHRFWPLQTGFAGKYINCIDFAGTLKPVVILHSDMFPNGNTDAENGNWYMKLQVTTKPLAGGTVDDNDPEKNDTESRTVLRYSFIPTCQFSISTGFFGSIPLPGMTVKATLNGETIEGTIESVNFTSPGIVTVNGVNWSRLQFTQQLHDITSSGSIHIGV